MRIVLAAGAAVWAGGVRIYLDHITSVPVRSEVAQQIVEDLASGLRDWTNPSAQHTAGRRVGALLAQVRARLASALGVDAHEVLLTSGGTETDALAVSGRACAMSGGRLVVFPIEYPAVLDSARTVVDQLEAGLSLLEVDGVGRVELDSVDRAVAPAGHTNHSPASLASVMMVDNETGVVQDMAVLVERVQEASGVGCPGEAGHVPIHSDVVAALGKVPVDLHDRGLDVMSLTGHKLGASVGVGALVARRDLGSTPATGGGRQERGSRPGTRDVAVARALALMMELAAVEREEQEARLAVLRRRTLKGAGAFVGVHATLSEGTDHVASTAHLWPEKTDAETLLMVLDLAGIDASAESACHARVTQLSHVLLTMGFEEGPARSMPRCSLGREMSLDDVERLLAAPSAVPEGSGRAWKVTHEEQ